MQNLATDKSIAIVGLGATGLSCARYLASRGTPFCVMDTRSEPPGLASLETIRPNTPVHLGGIKQDWLDTADEIWLSPGISRDLPGLALNPSDERIRGDIDVFSEVANAPIVGITGSNGKSTVTTLLGAMAVACGLQARVGGNLGTPALDLLHHDTDLYVLELSSFQLETTHKLGALAAVILNLSPDHMDRYADIGAYHAAKMRIFRGCQGVVFNRDDALTQPPEVRGIPRLGFTLKSPDLNEYGIQQQQDAFWLAKGLELLLDTRELKIRGRHNWANALAALALAELAGLNPKPCLQALREFHGLPHRCEWIAQRGGVDYFNDSKATNIGACLAAVHGLEGDLDGRLFLILGGQGKGQDFQALKEGLHGRPVIGLLIGESMELLEATLKGTIEIHCAHSLEGAVDLASDQAKEGDCVLLSPACASFDQFRSYEDRGFSYRTLVENME